MTSLAFFALEIKSKSAKSVMYLLRMFLSKLSMISFETTISLPTSSFSWIDEDGNGIFPIAIQASGGGDIANVSAIVVDAIPGN